MTISLKSLYRDDSAADSVEYPDWPDVKFRVKSFHSPSFKTAQQMLLKKMNRIYGNKPVPPEVQHEEWGKLYCNEILEGWEGLDEPYTPERAKEIMTDYNFRAVQEAVEWCARKRGEVDAEVIENTGKNSQAGSDGSLNAEEQTSS